MAFHQNEYESSFAMLINIYVMKTNKRFFTSLLCAFLLSTVSSQVRYEDLDRLSKQISEIQYRSQPFQTLGMYLSFPEESCKVFFSSKLASFAYYGEDNRGEQLIVQDEIDLSKTKSIFFQKEQDGSEFIVILLNSPGNMKVIKDDKQTDMRSSALYFFYQRGNEADKKSLFDNLTELVSILRTNADQKNRTSLEKEQNDWQKAVSINTAQSYTEFSDRYSKSIFFTEAQARAKAKDPIATLKLSEFYIGMRKSEFENIVRSRAQQIEVSKKTPLLEEVKNNYQFKYSDHNSFSAYNSLSDLSAKVNELRTNKQYDYNLNRIRSQLLAARISSSLGLYGFIGAELDYISFGKNDIAQSVQVNVTYPSDYTDWDEIRQAFINKFGEPSEKYTERSSGGSYISFRWPEKGYGLVFKNKFDQILVVKLYKNKYDDPSVRSPVMLEIGLL